MAGELEFIHLAAAVAGISTVAAALWGSARQRKNQSSAEYGKGAGLVTRLWYLIALTVIYFGIMVIIWRPIPFTSNSSITIVLDIIGAAIFFPSTALYLSGMRTLGKMFGPSNAFGARLYARHQLVTSGPYRIIRHPMYIGAIAAGVGGLLIFRTWGMLFFAVSMLGLAVRARVEEKLLAREFGQAWDDYKRKVPAWIPRRR